jgi:hypothetical protein
VSPEPPQATPVLDVAPRGTIECFTELGPAMLEGGSYLDLDRLSLDRRAAVMAVQERVTAEPSVPLELRPRLTTMGQRAGSRRILSPGSLSRVWEPRPDWPSTSAVRSVPPAGGLGFAIPAQHAAGRQRG